MKQFLPSGLFALIHHTFPASIFASLEAPNDSLLGGAKRNHQPKPRALLQHLTLTMVGYPNDTRELPSLPSPKTEMKNSVEHPCHGLSDGQQILQCHTWNHFVNSSVGMQAQSALMA